VLEGTDHGPTSDGGQGQDLVGDDDLSLYERLGMVRHGAMILRRREAPVLGG